MENTLPYIVAVDFDGTLCEDKFPNIGAPKTEVINIIKQYKSFGWKIILWTCRNGDALVEACAWCKEQGLKFDAINHNIPEVQEAFGGDTRKVYANAYIDDKNVLLKEVDRNGFRSNHSEQHP